MKTKRWIRKLGALILSAIMVIAGMPAMDVMAAEPINYYITIAGKQVTSQYLSNAAEGWKYTPATGTESAKLTLTNAHITYDSGEAMELTSENSLEIILEGDNYVTATGLKRGAISADDVNITGNGSLTVLSKAGYYAMSADVCVGENATLVVKTEKVENSLKTNVGLRSWSLDVKSGGVFIAQGEPSAIAVKYGKMTIGEGNVIVGGESSDKVTLLSKKKEIPEFMGGWEDNYEGFVNEDGTFAKYVHIGPTYAVTVNGGTVSDAMGSDIESSISGGTVTVKADAAPAGKIFDKWIVESGNVTLEDATKSTTTFVMPRGDVKLTAKFVGENEKEEVNVGTTKIIGKNVYKVITSNTVSYTKSQNKTKATITIPDTVTINGKQYKVTSVASNAFKNNTKLKKIIIGKNVTKIGAAAFANCKKLKTVTIGRSVKTIGDKAFKNCTALTKITLPGKVIKIGKEAFAGCKKLKSITIKSKGLKRVGKNAIKGIHKKCKIKVPDAKLKAYKKLFKNKGQKKTVKVVK